MAQQPEVSLNFQIHFVGRPAAASRPEPPLAKFKFTQFGARDVPRQSVVACISVKQIADLGFALLPLLIAADEPSTADLGEYRQQNSGFPKLILLPVVEPENEFATMI